MAKFRPSFWQDTISHINYDFQWYTGSQDSAVSIQIGAMNPGRGKRFSLLQNVQTSSVATQPPIQQLPSFCPGGTGAGGNVDHLPPYNAKFKNGWR